MQKPLALLAFTTLAFAGASFWLWREVSAQRAELASAQARIRDLEHTSSVEVEAADSASAAVQGESAAMSRTRSALATPARSFAEEQAERAEIEQRNRAIRADQKARGRWLLRDREARAARVERLKLGLMSRFSDLQSLLHLDSETIERLAALEAEAQVRNLEDPPMIPDGQLDLDPAVSPASVLKQQAEQRRYEAQLASLLGEEKVKEWQDYQRTASARGVARELRNMLEGSANPLEETQMPALVRAIADQQLIEADLRTTHPIAARGLRDESERIPMLERFVEMGVRQVQQRHDAVAPYLSPAQLIRYDEMNRLRLEQLRNDLRMARATQSVEQRGAPKP